MTRQPNGRPKIYKGADGAYHCYVTVGKKSNGKPDRRHLRGLTTTVVADKIETLEQSLRQGHVPAPGAGDTVAEWLEHWLSTIAARKVRRSTLDGYESKVRYRIIPALGGHRLAKLRAEHIEAFYASIESQVAPATALQIHRILSRALKVATQRGKIPRNPCALVDAPSAERAELDTLNEAEIRAILTAAAEQRNAARWWVALALGLRQGEALALHWSDLDLTADPPTLAVRSALARQRWRHGCGNPQLCAKRQCRTKPCPEDCRRHKRACPPPCPPTCERHASTCPKRHSGGVVFGSPKSRKSRRVLPLHAALVEQLRRHRKEQVAEKLAAGKWTDNDLVFCREDGSAIPPRQDWGAWRELLAAAGLRNHRLHSARHAFATVGLGVGIPARVVMEMLGHSQIALTLGTYSHVLPEVLKSATDQIGAAVSRVQPLSATAGGADLA